ncbi:hypothetical protein ABW19_dt0210100 [Dactylella cylindrospora]|nr:hypothetical protein ABW19_dt0210100 [Dactylella cylindrospora]
MADSNPPPAEAPASSYVPPHLRHRDPNAPPPSGVPYTLPQQYFFSSVEISKHFGASHGGTINPSINNVKEPAYILIFANQHPQYPPDIFVKSNLELIFKDAEKGGDMNPLLEGLEIPMFEEDKKGYGKAFRFKSWVKVKEVKRLEKKSEDLISMLTEKWKRDTPRRGGFRERERSRNDPDAKVLRKTEVGENGEEKVIETVVFATDEDEEDKSPGVEIPITQKLENTRPRSEMAWKNSLSVDWAVVTLEVVETEKGNPMHGPPVERKAPAKVEQEEKKEEGEYKDVEQIINSTDSLSLADSENGKSGVNTLKSKKKNEKIALSKFLQTDGAEDTLLVNDDCDAASIPSSPVLEPMTPRKGSAINLSNYSLTKPADVKFQERSGYGLKGSHSDISQSYISTGMGESVVDDFGAISAASETDADESDRWSELSDHDQHDDKQWMAVERNGIFKEVC